MLTPFPRTLLILFAVFVSGRVLTAADTPNLLVIQTDEHHYNTLGCYGGTIVETPNIDWLARNGALCTSFYATTPVCSPSRAALVSGRYPQNTPVVSNNIPLDDRIVTFAEVLRQRGYATGYAGKWHLDGSGKPQWAPERQFGFSDNRFMFNRGHWKQFADTSKGPAVGARNAKGMPTYSVEGADDKSFATDWLVDKAIDFLNTNREKSFCYMLSLPDPHGPNTVRPPYDKMFADVEVPIPVSFRKQPGQTPKWATRERGLTIAKLKRLMPTYYGMVKCIDDNIGRIVSCLRENGQLENTIIVFTSDHGDLCGEHGRLNKGIPYEGSARIPFLVYYPAQVPAGTVVNPALSCVDFLPTIFTMMGVEPPEGIEGRDASSLLRGEGEDWKDVAFLRGTGQTGWVCAVNDRYKLVYSPKDEPWLFDLQEDPDELKNVFQAEALQPLIRELTAELIEYGRRHNDPSVRVPAIKQAMESVVRGS